MSMHESEAESLSVFLCAGNYLNLSALIMSERKMFGIFHNKDVGSDEGLIPATVRGNSTGKAPCCSGYF